MPSSATLDRFIARVEANAHAEAIAEFYTEQASIRENQSPPRTGREALVAGERKMLGRVRSMTSTCLRPALINGDHVAIRWRFHFEWQDGSVTDMEEIAWQRWEGESIAEEVFFYDPAQRVPRQR